MRRKILTAISIGFFIAGLTLIIAPRVSNQVGKQKAHSTIEDFKSLKSEATADEVMTMSEFVASALDNELHPKISEKEGDNMANTRTVAFQVPEELFQRIKDYLNRNHMTQKQFLQF